MIAGKKKEMEILDCRRLYGKSTRRPEEKDVYEDQAEVDSYARASRKGPIVWAERMFVRSILNQFQSRPGLRVLDVGTGPGWIPIRLARARPDWKITALDGSAAMLEKAAGNARAAGVSVEWRETNAEASDLAAGQFDLVISRFALHEFSNPAAVLREVMRLLATGGELLLQDLERPAPWYGWMLRTGGSFNYRNCPKMKEQYLSSLRASYRLGELRDLLRSAGIQAAARRAFTAAGPLVEIRIRKEA